MSDLYVREATAALGISERRFAALCATKAVPAPEKVLPPTWRREAFYASTTALRRSGYIYFIFSDPDFIKIGFTGDVSMRLRELRSSSPHELTLLHSMSGTLAREGEILEAFADVRHRGEWFRDHPALRQFVDRLRSRGDRVHERIREPK